MKLKTVIMAGGKGTRIQSVFSNVPKPMITIAGVPVLERELISLRDQGLKDIIITVGHMADTIVNYFRDGSRCGINISYYREIFPLGTAGACFMLRDQIGEDPFFLLNGDAIFDIDFNRMMSFHKDKGALITLFTHPNSHPFDSSVIVSDADKAVRAWYTKEDVRPEYYKNRVNAGIHIIEPSVFDMIDIAKEHVTSSAVSDGDMYKIDLDRQVIKPLIKTGKVFCYDSPEYIKDMGTPERLHDVEIDFHKGIVSSRNLSLKQKAVFIDRDGTINTYKGFLRSLDEFELINGVASAIKCINDSSYLVIVVTNQPVIARGEISIADLEIMHNKMETLLGKEGAHIDALYFCPHHPDKGFEGEIANLKIDCDCRKPKPGMLLQAAKDFNIDLSQSYIVGDSANDIYAGIAAGCKPVLINGIGTSGENSDYGQICTLESLSEFVDKYILSDGI